LIGKGQSVHSQKPQACSSNIPLLLYISTGSHISHTLLKHPEYVVQIASRNPDKLHARLLAERPFDAADQFLPPKKIDILQPSTLVRGFSGARTIISLVGILHGSEEHFEKIQYQGALNVAKAAKEAGVERVIHFGAIGADINSTSRVLRTRQSL
jgi:uncharacterized protein YbjT (DUF2867 family)